MTLCAVLGTAALAAFPGSARAANAVPNPSFETDCSGVPCSWTATGSSGMARVTTFAHTGTASMQVTEGPAAGGGGAVTACVAMPAGTHAASVWYRTTDAEVDFIDLTTIYFSDSNCVTQNPIPAPLIFTSSPVTTGAWDKISGSTVAPAGTQSARFRLFFAVPIVLSSLQGPQGTQSNGASVYFDDVVVCRPRRVDPLARACALSAGR